MSRQNYLAQARRPAIIHAGGRQPVIPSKSGKLNASGQPVIAARAIRNPQQRAK